MKQLAFNLNDENRKKKPILQQATLNFNQLK